MTGLDRLTRPQIMIIGAVLVVLIVAGIFFFLIKPLNERLAAANSKYDTQKQIADQRPQAEQAVKEAKAEVARAEARWRQYDRAYMSAGPNNAGINRESLLGGIQQLWQEQTNILGPLATRFLRADKSVRILQANLTVPAPPSDPNAVNRKVIELPLGQVSVQGKFNNILNHASRWNQFKRLVLVDGLALSGNSPNLVGQYSLTAYIFTRGKNPGAYVPQAGGGAGGGGFGGPGGPGGPPPGYGGSGPPSGYDAGARGGARAGAF